MIEVKDNAVIQFRQVSYIVPEAKQPIVFDLKFEIHAGETLVLLGESGCGKTTTLKFINRLLVPTAGAVIVRGQATTEWNPIQLRRMIGYVIQDAGLFPHFTVERNIALVPELERWSKERIRERVREMLRLVNLEPKVFAQRYPRELSGGQRQRVGVARALAADPPLLLLDEPFGALDPLTRHKLQQEFGELCRQMNKTVVFVTHDLREALQLATRIGLMHEGCMRLLDAPDDFLRSPDEHARRYRETLDLKNMNSQRLAHPVHQPSVQQQPQ